MAQTIPKVDQAFEDKFTGAEITVDLGSGDEDIPVVFFQEQPSIEEAAARTFPSLSIALRDVSPDPDRRHGEQEGDRYKVAEDTGAVPYTSDMIPIPTPYRLTYFLETWNTRRAIVDRALQQLVLGLLGDRGVLTLTESGPSEEDEDVHAFMAGFENADTDIGDMRIYHKIYTYEVLVELGPADVLTVKQAMELRFEVKKGNRVAGVDLEDTPDLVTDTVIVVTD